MRNALIALKDGKKLEICVGRTYLIEFAEHFPAAEDSIFKRKITDHEIYILKVFDNTESNSLLILFKLEEKSLYQV